MFDAEKSLYAKNISPFIQGGAVIGAILLFNLFSWLISLTGLLPIKDTAPWLIFTSFVLCYALVNSVLSISSHDRNKYWMHSIISFVAICLVGGIVSYLISGLTMDEAGSYRWILIVFSIGYILFLSIVRAMQKIVTIAQKQDKRLRGEE